MKTLFLVICFLGAVIYAVYSFLLPAAYRIMEPFFEMPIKTTAEIITAENLPIRNDAYGDGYFGAKRKGGRLHKGLDLEGDLKEEVYASKSGWVRVRFVKKGYGNLVIIKHPGGHETRYGHLDSVSVKNNQWVRQGEVIGLVGKTGNADVKGMTPHLHFEIRKNDEPVNPANKLAGHSDK